MENNDLIHYQKLNISQNYTKDELIQNFKKKRNYLHPNATDGATVNEYNLLKSSFKYLLNKLMTKEEKKIPMFNDKKLSLESDFYNNNIRKQHNLPLLEKEQHFDTYEYEMAGRIPHRNLFNDIGEQFNDKKFNLVFEHLKNTEEKNNNVNFYDLNQKGTSSYQSICTYNGVIVDKYNNDREWEKEYNKYDTNKLRYININKLEPIKEQEYNTKNYNDVTDEIKDLRKNTQKITNINEYFEKRYVQKLEKENVSNKEFILSNTNYNIDRLEESKLFNSSNFVRDGKIVIPEGAGFREK